MEARVGLRVDSWPSPTPALDPGTKEAAEAHARLGWVEGPSLRGHQVQLREARLSLPDTQALLAAHPGSAGGPGGERTWRGSTGPRTPGTFLRPTCRPRGSSMERQLSWDTLSPAGHTETVLLGLSPTGVRLWASPPPCLCLMLSCPQQPEGTRLPEAP